MKCARALCSRHTAAALRKPHRHQESQLTAQRPRLRPAVQKGQTVQPRRTGAAGLAGFMLATTNVSMCVKKTQIVYRSSTVTTASCFRAATFQEQHARTSIRLIHAAPIHHHIDDRQRNDHHHNDDCRRDNHYRNRGESSTLCQPLVKLPAGRPALGKGTRQLQLLGGRAMSSFLDSKALVPIWVTANMTWKCSIILHYYIIL